MNLISSNTKAILFDHDDTLVKTIEAKWAEHRYIAKKYYGKILSDDDLREHWGKPLSTVMKLLYETEDIETAMSYNIAIHEKFPKKLHGDTLRVLRQLREQRIKIGVITATNHYSLQYDLETMSFPVDLFDYIQTEESTAYHKPDPRVFEPALKWLKQIGISHNEALYIGDSLQDMKAAVGAGFAFIGVCTGLVTQEDFNDHGVPSISRLSDLISKTN